MPVSNWHSQPVQTDTSCIYINISPNRAYLNLKGMLSGVPSSKLRVTYQGYCLKSPMISYISI
jgi:hypothetical protein